MAPGAETSNINYSHINLRNNETVRRELAIACRALSWYKIGLTDGVFNHVSALALSKSGKSVVILLIPYGVLWHEVTPELIAAMDPTTGKIVEGKAKLTKSDIYFHLTAYRRRVDCAAIFHCHPTYAVALGCLKDYQVRNISVTTIEIHGKIAYDRDFSNNRKDYSTEFDRWFDCLGEKNILMTGNHGVTTIGCSVAHAFDLMCAAEQGCRIQVLAMSTGKEMRDIAEERSERFNSLVNQEYSDHCQMHLDAFVNLLSRK